jgi:hypothetical protein
VNPTKSANNTDTSRRSATGASPAADAVATEIAPVSNGAPQSPQNLLPGSLELPQEEQTVASALPQSPQNFFAEGFSAPQFEQTTIRKA